MTLPLDLHPGEMTPRTGNQLFEDPLTVVEICCGAGGQALGLHRAGFNHFAAIDSDSDAAHTFESNFQRLTSASRRPLVEVRVGDVRRRCTLRDFCSTPPDLFAAGVPCPPFSTAGKMRGSADPRDLLSTAVDIALAVRAGAILIENVAGLSCPRFADYREFLSRKLNREGYIALWNVLRCSDFGVPQHRRRTILIALPPLAAGRFRWPAAQLSGSTVAQAIGSLMSGGGWPGADNWVSTANRIGPTIVGGSRLHGGADLGPSGARAAWARLKIDGSGIADAPPGRSAPPDHRPRLTLEMVARLQGWNEASEWRFQGSKTNQYRQIANALPPPVAEAIGRSIACAIRAAAADSARKL